MVLNVILQDRYYHTSLRGFSFITSQFYCWSPSGVNMWDHSFSPSILNNWVQRSVVMNTPMTYTFTVFSLHLPFSQVSLKISDCLSNISSWMKNRHQKRKLYKNLHLLDQFYTTYTLTRQCWELCTSRVFCYFQNNVAFSPTQQNTTPPFSFSQNQLKSIFNHINHKLLYLSGTKFCPSNQCITYCTLVHAPQLAEASLENKKITVQLTSMYSSRDENKTLKPPRPCFSMFTSVKHVQLYNINIINIL